MENNDPIEDVESAIKEAELIEEGTLQSDYKPFDYLDWADMLNQWKGGDVKDLRAFWGEIQKHKQDSLIYIDENNAPDYMLRDKIFDELEFPVIKKIFPPVEFKKRISDWVRELLKRAKAQKKEKFDKYIELRRAGATFKDAKRIALQALTFTSYDHFIKGYSRPFSVSYDLNTQDADMLFSMGLDEFCKLNFSKFYHPVEKIIKEEKKHATTSRRIN